MRAAVVGHVEWIELARVPRAPAAGEIVHAEALREEAGGGGAVAAVQLAKLAGGCLFITALGDDELGRRSARRLKELGVRVEAAWRPPPQRRAFVHVDPGGERTITVIGDRHAPRAADELPWNELAGADAVYFTAGDAAALRASRAARTLVATVRAGATLAEAGIALDAAVASARDPGERYEPGDLDPAPTLVVRTEGAAGGSMTATAGGTTRWEAAPLPGPPGDSYGAGDSFAAGLAYGLGDGRAPSDALALAARCGAACAAGYGPYEGQLAAAS